MSFSTLRVTEAGVVLFAQHARRLGHTEALLHFAQTAAPGVYRVQVDGQTLQATRREESQLHDGIALRVLPSPLPPSAGRIAKPTPPGPYAPLRTPGMATLLCSPDGRELWESCTAALLGWDGARLLAPPLDRPRVRSTAEDALEEAGLLHRAPLPRESQALLLINALGSAIPAGSTFPEPLRAELVRALAATAQR